MQYTVAEQGSPSIECAPACYVAESATGFLDDWNHGGNVPWSASGQQEHIQTASGNQQRTVIGLCGGEGSDRRLWAHPTLRVELSGVGR